MSLLLRNIVRLNLNFRDRGDCNWKSRGRAHKLIGFILLKRDSCSSGKKGSTGDNPDAFPVFR
mgnify:CR=1 FL=1